VAHGPIAAFFFLSYSENGFLLPPFSLSLSLSNIQKVKKERGKKGSLPLYKDLCLAVLMT
jgi:hypothetical protein